MFADEHGSLRGTVTHRTLSRVLTHVREQQWPADFVAMTGDIIQDDTPAAYDRFLKHFAPLNLPTLCVPGNHDDRDLMRKALSQPLFHYCGELTFNNWLVAGVDSAVSDTAGGRVSDEELRRLNDILMATSAEHVMVCLHHPPLPVGSKWLDQVGLENGNEFLQLLEQSGKVRIALFGHVHQSFEATHKSIQIIGTPSTCRQFKIGSDDFALDENPPAYRRLSLHKNGSIEQQLIWLGADDN